MKNTHKKLLLQKIKKDKGCWLWQGKGRVKAYGKLTLNKTTWLAHRAAYFLFTGSIPKGVFVLHRCDRPLCINPKHLFLGTQRDNMNDARTKGRIYTTSLKGTRAQKITQVLGWLRVGRYKQKRLRKTYHRKNIHLNLLKELRAF